MPIEDADFKIRESEFFLGLLAVEADKALRPEPEHLEYYLSAFMSAAYSIYDMLKAVDKAKVTDWTTNLPGDGQSLLGSMRMRRGSGTHDRKLKTKIGHRERPVHEVPGLTVFAPPGVPQSTFLMTTHSFERMGPGDVVITARRYLDLLKSLRTLFN